MMADLTCLQRVKFVSISQVALSMMEASCLFCRRSFACCLILKSRAATHTHIISKRTQITDGRVKWTHSSSMYRSSFRSSSSLVAFSALLSSSFRFTWHTHRRHGSCKRPHVHNHVDIVVMLPTCVERDCTSSALEILIHLGLDLPSTGSVVATASLIHTAHKASGLVC